MASPDAIYIHGDDFYVSAKNTKIMKTRLLDGNLDDHWEYEVNNFGGGNQELGASPMQTKGARGSCPLGGACGRDAHDPFNKRLCNFRACAPCSRCK